MRRGDEEQVVNKLLRKWALGTLVVVTLALGWVGSRQLNDPEILPLHQVRLVGIFSHISEQEAQRAVMPFLSQGFLGIDMNGLRQTFKRMPWVQSVSVRRVWPDKLEIELIEQLPLAYWGQRALVNSEGEVFVPAATPANLNIPRFVGPAGLAGEMTQRWREISNLLAPLKLAVTGLAVDERRAWRVQVNGGMELLLGRSDNHARLVRFIGVYQKVLAAHAAEIERVDLRYTNGMAVSMKKLPATEQTEVKGTT